MSRTKVVITLILFGTLSFGTLLYFYLTQRSFTYNQRAFLIHLDNLDNRNSDLTSEILKNSLFAYNSQDKIASDYTALQNELTALKNTKILQNKPYQKLKQDIETQLQTQIDDFLIKVQNFLLLNAAVKNSLVFLSSHVDRADYVQKRAPLLYIEATHIVNKLQNARAMQDFDYIHNLKYLLQTDTKDKHIRRFVKIFNLHAAYLSKKLPEFIQITDSVVHNNINKTIHAEKKEFNKIVLTDFQFFDRFAYLVAALLLLYFFLVLYLFFRYQKTNTLLNYAISHDHLTGLYDRSFFIHSTEANKDKLQTVLLLNIDAFKEINDLYGNEFGNRVLLEVTKFLEEYFSTMKNTTLYRVGGDEFAILFKEKRTKEALQIAHDLAHAIRNNTFSILNNPVNLSVSIAVNATPPLLENADLALKIVKKDSNRHIIEYKDELSLKKEWKNNMQIVHMVKSALHEDRIVPYFQGIVNLKTMKIEKYESLVRLLLPSGEVLSPYAFLETVSKTHYYYSITKVMIKKTIETARRYPMYRFSINVSMKDIINKDITDTLFSLFDRDRETALRIDIELLETELVAIHDKRINDFITKVHSYGSKILIDDFGTGYSNFAYLSELNIDTIKIDASITKEITTNPKKLHILKTIANFTHGMNMQNVAEYVETKEIALLLQEIGIEYAQGYLFSKPLPKPLAYSDVSL